MSKTSKLTSTFAILWASLIFYALHNPAAALKQSAAPSPNTEKIDQVAEAYGDARVLRNSFLRGISRFKKTASETDMRSGRVHYENAKTAFNQWIDDEIADLLTGGKGSKHEQLQNLKMDFNDASQKLNKESKAQIIDNWVKLYSVAIANEPYALTTITSKEEEKAKLMNGFNDTLGNFRTLFSLTRALVDRGIWIVQLGRLKLPNFEDVPTELKDNNLIVLDPQNWPVLVKQIDEKGGCNDSTLTAGDSKDKTYVGGEYSPFPRIAPSALRIRTSDPYYKFDENDSIKMSDFARMNSRGVHLMPQNHSIPRSVRSDMAP